MVIQWDVPLAIFKSYATTGIVGPSVKGSTMMKWGGDGQWQAAGYIYGKQWARAHYFLGSKCNSLCKGASRVTYLSSPLVTGKTKCKTCERLHGKMLASRIVQRLPAIEV